MHLKVYKLMFDATSGVKPEYGWGCQVVADYVDWYDIDDLRE
jgi:hypothetical protein